LEKLMALLTYAIGDIHGSFTRLANLLRHCRDHHGSNPARFVFLGDYIDRGGRSREVVALLMETQRTTGHEVVCLKGNHEDLLLSAANRQTPEHDPALWLDNGGDATLRSYGVERAEQIPAEHLAWFENLPLSTKDERRFFVHAGIKPGIPLAQQQKKTLLWIREPFLSDQSDHGHYIVHGHTPTETGAPDVRHNRLNLDTLAWRGHPLFAAVFEERRVGPMAFIADDGSIAPAAPINAREQEMFPPERRARVR
jgi:serine/threonine protein phosphatase 1